MSPLLSTTATCVCHNTLLEGKSLRDVAEDGLRKAENPPSYKVKLTKRKVSFKPDSEGVKKLKSIKLRKVDDTYVNEKSDVVAFSYPYKKNPTCLALQFKDTDTRKQFQTLSKNRIPPAKKSTKDETKNNNKKSESKNSHQDEASNKNKSEGALEPVHREHSDSTITLSDIKGPQQSRRSSSPQRSHDGGKRSSLSPSVKDGSSVCSHCHQKLPNRILASKIEYNPPNCLPSRSPRQRAKSYDFSFGGSNGSVCFIGPRSSTRKSHQSSSTGRDWVPYYRSHARVSPSHTQTDESEDSSITSTTSSFEDGHFIRVGTVTCRTPVPRRRSSQLKTPTLKPTSQRQNSRRGKSQSIVYYIYDPSSDEEDESGDYDSSSTSMDESGCSYDNAPIATSTRAKKIDKLLHELGKPGAIRLY